jgi:hypothetical protein
MPKQNQQPTDVVALSKQVEVQEKRCKRTYSQLNHIKEWLIQLRNQRIEIEATIDDLDIAAKKQRSNIEKISNGKLVSSIDDRDTMFIKANKSLEDLLLLKKANNESLREIDEEIRVAEIKYKNLSQRWEQDKARNAVMQTYLSCGSDLRVIRVRDEPETTFNLRLAREIPWDGFAELGFTHHMGTNGDPRSNWWELEANGFEIDIDAWYEVTVVNRNNGSDYITVKVECREDLEDLICFVGGDEKLDKKEAE